MKQGIVKPGLPADLQTHLSIRRRYFLTLSRCANRASADVLHVFVDARTSALYSECHIFADKLAALATTDVPLDPDDQPEYPASREIVADHVAFKAMKADAKGRRSFSDISTNSQPSSTQSIHLR